MAYKDKIDLYHKKYYLENKKKLSNHKKNYYKKRKKYFCALAKEYRKNNQEEYKIKDKLRYLKNRDKLLLEKRNYFQKNKKRINQYKRKWFKRRSKIDKNFKVKLRLKRLLLSALYRLGNGKNKPSKKYGINFYEIIEYLKPFPKDISKYHIDHIRPLCSFTFVNEDGSENLEQIQEAFRPENHQWLLAEENMRKNGKFEEKE